MLYFVPDFTTTKLQSYNMFIDFILKPTVGICITIVLVVPRHFYVLRSSYFLFKTKCETQTNLIFDIFRFFRHVTNVLKIFNV